MSGDRQEGGRSAAMAPPGEPSLDPRSIAAQDEQRRREKEERCLARRARVLDAFIEVVGTVGLSQSRITEICRKAGVSNRSFYATFVDKEACFVAAFEARARMLTERAKQAYDEVDGAWEDRLRAGLETIISYLVANPSYARFCTVEAARMRPDASERLNTVIRDCQRVFKSDVCLQLPPPLQGGPLGSLLCGGILQPIFMYVERGRIDQLSELVTELVYFVTLMVLGPERALLQLDVPVGGVAVRGSQGLAS